MRRRLFSIMKQFDLRRYADAGYSLLAVETHEEERLLQELTTQMTNNSDQSDRHLLVWDCIGGLSSLTEQHTSAGSSVALLPGLQPVTGLSTPELLGVLSHFTQSQKYRRNDLGNINQAVLVLLDVHRHLEDPHVLRWFRTAHGMLREQGHLIILVSPSWKMPTELRCEVTQMELELPQRASLLQQITKFIQTNVRESGPEHYRTLEFPEDIKQLAAEALQGLTSMQAANALSLVLITMTRNGQTLKLDGEFVRQLFEEKIQQLKSGILEYMPPDRLAQVAGLNALRAWVATRKFSFTEAAREMGLPYPNGVALVGVPGCGKTIMAREIATQFNLPLYKLDIGRLFASKVGETEALTREVIRQMDSIGGAVILLDEIEKHLSINATSGAGDSGTSSRMFGTLLNWMSSKQCPVFLVATSNNMDALPPELTRPGRFDAVFWVDVPTLEERVGILRLQFKPHHEMSDSAIEQLASQTEGYTGAELAALVQESTLRFFSGARAGHSSYGSYLLSNLQLVRPQQANKESVLVLRGKVDARGWLRAGKTSQPAGENRPADDGKTGKGRRKLNLPGGSEHGSN